MFLKSNNIFTIEFSIWYYISYSVWWNWNAISHWFDFHCQDFLFLSNNSSNQMNHPFFMIIILCPHNFTLHEYKVTNIHHNKISFDMINHGFHFHFFYNQFTTIQFSISEPILDFRKKTLAVFSPKIVDTVKPVYSDCPREKQKVAFVDRYL